MMIAYTLRGKIDVPEGSKLSDTHSAIILPGGDTLKLWEAWELNEDGDLDSVQMEKMGCHFDGDMAVFEENFDG